MTNRISRREFGRLSVAGMSLAALGGLTRPASAETTLRYIWWGNPDRDKRTNAAIDLYNKKNPDVAVDRESYAWADYWPKLATQAAGGNLPERHPDGLPLHFRVGAPRPARRFDADARQPAEARQFRQEPAEQRHDRRQALWPVDGRKLGRAGLQQDQIRRAQDRPAGPAELDLRRLHQDRQGRAAASSGGHAFHRQQGRQ